MRPRSIAQRQQHFPRTSCLNGLFTITWTNRIANVKDGTSNTVVIAEVNSTGHKYRQPRPPADQRLCGCGRGEPRFNADERIYRAAFVWAGRWGNVAKRERTRIRLVKAPEVEARRHPQVQWARDAQPIG